MEGRGSEGISDLPMAEGSARAHDSQGPPPSSSWPVHERLDVFGTRQAVQQRRRRCQQRQRRLLVFCEPCICTQQVNPRLSRKGTASVATINCMPKVRGDWSSCYQGMDASFAAQPAIHVARASQAVLCPVSLQVGMELALFASRLEIAKPAAFSAASGQRVSAASSCAPTAIAELQATEEAICSPEEASERLPSCSSRAARQRTGIFKKSPELHAEATNHLLPRLAFHLNSNGVWQQLLRAYGLADPPASLLVELLLRRALESVELPALFVDRPEKLQDGTLLARILAFGDAGSLHPMGVPRAAKSGASKRHFSSPVLSSSCTACSATPMGSPKSDALAPLRVSEERRGDAQRQPDGQPAASGQQQRSQLTPERGGPSDASASVARIRAMLELRTHATACLGHSGSPPSPPLPPETPADRPGRPLVRLQVPERADAPASFSAPPPVAVRWPLWEAPGAGAGGGPPGELVCGAEGPLDRTPEGLAERAAGRPAVGQASENDGVAAAAGGGRRRSESARPRSCESWLVDPTSGNGRINMSIRSEDGGFVLQGRFVPHFLGHRQSTPRGGGEADVAQHGMRPETPLNAFVAPSAVPVRPHALLPQGSPPQQQQEQEQEQQQQPQQPQQQQQQQQATTQRLLLREASGGEALSAAGSGEAAARGPLRVELQRAAAGASRPLAGADPPTLARWELRGANAALRCGPQPSATSVQSLPLSPARSCSRQLQGLTEASSLRAVPQGSASQQEPSYSIERNTQATSLQTPQLAIFSSPQTIPGSQQQQLYDPRPQPPSRDGNVLPSAPCGQAHPPSLSVEVGRQAQAGGEYVTRVQENLLLDMQQQQQQQQHGMQQVLCNVPPSVHRREFYEAAGYHHHQLHSPGPFQLRTQADRDAQALDPDELHQPHLRRQHAQYPSSTESSRAAGRLQEGLMPAYMREMPLRRGASYGAAQQPVFTPHPRPHTLVPHLDTVGTPLVPLRSSEPQDNLSSHVMQGRQTAEGQMHCASHRGNGLPESSTASTGASCSLGEAGEPGARRQGLFARRHRGSSLSSFEVNSQPVVHAAGADWTDVSSAFVHSGGRAEHFALSPQRHCGNWQQVEQEQQQQYQQPQQHVYEQWMHKTEVHMERLERLMHRLKFLLEAVEERELGLN